MNEPAFQKYLDKYAVFKDGDIFILKGKNKNKRLSPYTDRYGYRVVTIIEKTVRKNIPVHRVLMTAYFGYSKLQINHRDGNKQNNNLDNLEYCTPGENLKHAYRLGLKNAKGSKNGRSKIDEENARHIKKLLKEGIRQKDIGTLYGLDQSTISHIKRGASWCGV